MPNISKAEKEEILELYYDGFKKCTCCGEIKKLNRFYPVRTITNLIPFTRECIQCKSNKARIWYQKVKEVYNNRKNKSRTT